MAIEVAKVELKNVQDASGMEALIGKGQFRPTKSSPSSARPKATAG